MMRKVKIKERNEDYIASEPCRHYWIIEAANGPKSRGVCKHCGETRDFFNSIPSFTSANKRPANPLDLPKMPDVELDEGSKS